MKNILLLVMLFYLAGCGSIETPSNTDGRIARDLDKRGTYCETVPRMYSGVAYDFCHLHSRPASTTGSTFLELHLFDMGLSAIADTIALPYTAYRQATVGSIKLENQAF